jgi:general secretion pathway protein G
MNGMNRRGRGAHLATATILSLSSPKGGEGRGEEVSCFRAKVPSPQPSPRSGGERELAVASRCARGFTLVEMLLVLVILATLAAIIYPKVMGRSEQARLTAAQTQIANFKTALDAFEVDNGYYPKGKDGLLDLLQKPRDAAGWHGPYLESIPKDPWGNPYQYDCPGKHNASSYDISSTGPPNANTPIGNWQAQQR